MLLPEDIADKAFLDAMYDAAEEIKVICLPIAKKYGNVQFIGGLNIYLSHILATNKDAKTRKENVRDICFGLKKNVEAIRHNMDIYEEMENKCDT